MTQTELLKSFTTAEWAYIALAIVIAVTIIVYLSSRLLDYFDPLDSDDVGAALKRANEEVANRPHVRAISTPRGK